MVPALPSLLRREQRAFLARPRGAWEGHLGRIRAFFGEAFEAADPGRPVLVLGAGSGLELPWDRAPRGATGWDADPTSRLRTALRHHRFPPWVFADLTGGLAGLRAATARALAEPWSGRRRSPQAAAARLAGLLPSLDPRPEALEAWIRARRPGSILSANVLGQFGAVAHRLVGEAFAPADPWDPDPEGPDPLAEALDAWTARAVRAHLAALRESGADVWLVSDRAVLHGDGPVELGPFTPAWTAQVRAAGEVEASDPLAGVDLGAEFPGARRERWIWPLGPGQAHVMEALHAPGDQASGFGLRASL